MPPPASIRSAASTHDAVRLPLARVTRYALLLKCPLCGKDGPYHGLFGMRRSCRACGYVFAREDGYFLGSADVNFWVTFCVLVPFVLIGYLLFRGPWIAVSLVFTVVFPIWFFRYSKALYMLLDLALDPPTEADFTVRELETEGGQAAERRAYGEKAA
jgi:uncharacterized protein (DUF983 family)